MVRLLQSICLFLSFFSVFTSCTRSHKRPPPSAVPVSVFQVAPQTLPADFEFIGVGESSHIVELRARVEGYLTSIDYKEGGLVHAGDLMFVLDQRPFLAAVESARGELERRQALLWNAEQTKERMTPLYAQNAVSQRDFDNAIAEEWAARANVETAKANLYQAELNLGFASLSSPVTGMASRAKYREGALISPGEQNLLTTIYVVDPIWVNFSISDIELLKARKQVEEKKLRWPEGKQFRIEVILSDGTVLPSEGSIDFTNPAIQQSTGTLLLRAVVPNPHLLLYPGQFARVVVKGAVRPDALFVPQPAVMQGEKGPFVYVIKEGKAEVRPVTLGDWYKEYWVIEEGLHPGDLVVVQGTSKIRQASPVTILQGRR